MSSAFIFPALGAVCCLVNVFICRRWWSKAIFAIMLVLNMATFIALRSSDCIGAPSHVAYTPGMMLCPGQTTSITVELPR